VKDLRARGRSLVDEQSIFEAVTARRAVVAEAAVRTKAARREFERGAHLRRTGAEPVGDKTVSCPLADEDASDAALVPMPSEADRGSVEEWS
jgi:putative transposase